jgi:hypothetical protein
MSIQRILKHHIYLKIIYMKEKRTEVYVHNTYIHVMYCWVVHMEQANNVELFRVINYSKL